MSPDADDTVVAPATAADDVAQAVLAVPGVERLHAGAFGEVATYLPGRRVSGVSLREAGCEVHVVLSWGVAIAATTDRVRAAARALVGDPVDVVVEDVGDPHA